MVTSTESAKYLRDDLIELEALRKAVKSQPRRHSYPFEFDGTETTKVLPSGWKPTAVYLSGPRQLVGSGGEVTFTESYGIWTVTWDTAPLVTDWAYVDAEWVQ